MSVPLFSTGLPNIVLLDCGLEPPNIDVGGDWKDERLLKNDEFFEELFPETGELKKPAGDCVLDVVVALFSDDGSLGI